MKKIFLFFSMIFMVACNQPTKNSHDEEVLLLSYDYCASPFKNKFDGFKSTNFMPLETSDECLISSVYKVIYKKENIFIFDRNLSSIFIFDNNGAFVSKIHNIGTGPGEYPDIADFDLDAEQNIYITSLGGKKIIKYNAPTYTSYKVYPVNASVLEIAIDEKTGNIWVANVFESLDGVCLGLYTEADGIIPVIENRGVFDNVLSQFKMQSFYKSSNELFFNPRFSPYIYIIRNDTIEKYMKIDTPNFVSEEDIEQENELRVKDPRQLLNADKCFVYGVQSFYQCGESVLCNVWISSRGSVPLQYNLTNGKGELFNPLQDEKVKVYTKILTATDEHYVSYVDAASFVQFYDESLLDKKVNEDDNPILIFYNLTN